MDIFEKVFQKGELVYHDQLIFNDGVIDQKGHRPCIVLFAYSDATGEYVCTCSMSSNIEHFNKYPKSCFLNPIVTTHYEKLDFFKVGNVSFKTVENTHHLYKTLDDYSFDRLVDKILNYNANNDSEEFKKIRAILQYAKLFDKLDRIEINILWQAKERLRQKREVSQKAITK